MTRMDTVGRVAVTGASGLLGSLVTRRLTERGWEVASLVRRPPRTPSEMQWDPDRGVGDPSLLEGLTAVVHLAGAPIAERWTPQHRELILTSRVDGTRALVSALAALSGKPRVLVSASAVGWFGANRGDEILTEDSPPGDDFLARVGAGWEAEAQRAEQAGIRTVCLRFGVILSADGGALGKMLTPFRLGLGGPVGSGKQWMSWLSREDAAQLVIRALEDETMRGAYNATVGAVTNADFSRALGRVLGRPALLPAPVPILKLVFGGEMMDASLLASQRVEPARLRALGHTFLHPELEDALRAELA